MQRGIPFDVKLPASKPVEMAALSEAEMNQELEKGCSDFIQGKTKPAAHLGENHGNTGDNRRRGRVG